MCSACTSSAFQLTEEDEAERAGWTAHSRAVLIASSVGLLFCHLEHSSRGKQGHDICMRFLSLPFFSFIEAGVPLALHLQLQLI